MKLHPLDPVALISGLLFALSGLAIVADQQWGDVDVTALTAAAVSAVGLLLIALIVYRYVRQSDEPLDPPPADPE